MTAVKTPWVPPHLRNRKNKSAIVNESAVLNPATPAFKPPPTKSEETNPRKTNLSDSSPPLKRETLRGLGLMGSKYAPKAVKMTPEIVAMQDDEKFKTKAYFTAVHVHAAVEQDDYIKEARTQAALDPLQRGNWDAIQKGSIKSVERISEDIEARLRATAASNSSSESGLLTPPAPNDAREKSVSPSLQVEVASIAVTHEKPVLATLPAASGKIQSPSSLLRAVTSAGVYLADFEKSQSLSTSAGSTSITDAPDTASKKSQSPSLGAKAVSVTDLSERYHTPAITSKASSTPSSPEKSTISLSPIQTVRSGKPAGPKFQGLATDFAAWNSEKKDILGARPKAVAFTATPAKPIAPTHIRSSNGSKKVIDRQSNADRSVSGHSNAAQSTVDQSTAPGLTSASSPSSSSTHSSVEFVSNMAAAKFLLPITIKPSNPKSTAPDVTAITSGTQVSTPPKRDSILQRTSSKTALPSSFTESYSQDTQLGSVANTSAPQPQPRTAPMVTSSKVVPESTSSSRPIVPKLATTYAELLSFTPTPAHPPPAPKPKVQLYTNPTNKMAGGRRGGWLTKAETKAMRARPLSDCVIDEDDYEGEVQNNDWPSDENTSEVCLRQWDGDWLPAPVDWQGRNPHKQSSKFASDVATWVDRTNNHYLSIFDCVSKITIKDLKSGNFAKSLEHVPRSWVPTTVSGVPLQEFWDIIQQSQLPPIADEDMTMEPFWKNYNDETFQNALVVPDAHLDPGDPDLFLYKKGKNETARLTSDRHLAKVKRNMEKAGKMNEKQGKAKKKQAQRVLITPPPNPHKPAANIYLRPAFDRDLEQLVHIYNHWVNTPFSSAMTPMTREGMATLKRNVTAAELHMVVAVQKTVQIPDRHTSLHSTQERIVGFAFLDEHEGRGALFRYAADLEVFVHPDYLYKGIGKSLVDRMLFLSDPMYSSRDAVEWRPMSDDIHLVYAGGKRVLETVHINVFYPSEDTTRLRWIETWLTCDDFKFTKWGIIQGGKKLQKNIFKACFVHKSDLEVDPVSAYV